MNVSPSIFTVNCWSLPTTPAEQLSPKSTCSVWQSVLEPAAYCKKCLPLSSNNEVPSRNDLDISCPFGELLTGDQLPGSIQLTLLGRR